MFLHRYFAPAVVAMLIAVLADTPGLAEQSPTDEAKAPREKSEVKSDRSTAAESAAKSAGRKAARTGRSPSTQKPVAKVNPAPPQRRALGAAIWQNYQRMGWSIPRQATAADKEIRLLLLDPSGPILIQFEITLNGRPFRSYTEEVVERIFAVGDKNNDGKLTLDEAAEVPMREYSRYAYALDRKRRLLNLKRYDFNGDGRLSPLEARALIAQSQGGPAFTVMRNTYNPQGAASSAVFKLLDANGNESLEPAELAAAGDRLKGRDANDDDILEQTELFGAGAYSYRPYGGRTVQPALLLWDLTDSTDWKALHAALKTRYAPKAEALTPAHWRDRRELAVALDADQDTKVTPDELAKLLLTDAHLAAEIHLGETGDLAEGMRLLAPPAGLGKAKASVQQPHRILIAGEESQVDLRSVNIKANVANYDRYAMSFMQRFDKDKNAYLDRKELSTPEGQGLLRQFGAYDTNDDGKIYGDEIKAYYVRNQEAQLNRVSAIAMTEGNVLLAAIDKNGDGRIGLREMRAAGQRLKAFDKDNNGAISGSELPQVMRLTIARGRYAYQYQYRRTLPTQRASSKTGGGDRPEWFVRMDRNGDGDISRREFLGNREQFKKLDANGDGFIEAKEARAAGK